MANKGGKTQSKSSAKRIAIQSAVKNKVVAPYMKPTPTSKKPC